MDEGKHMRRYSFLTKWIALTGACVITLQLFGHQLIADSFTTTYTYDAAGQLVGVDYGNGSRINYLYDKVGNLTDLEILVGGSTTRNLTSNYTVGQKGSFFTITGQNFPPYAWVRISINYIALDPLIQCDANGSFTLIVSTATADDGFYTITATQVSAATQESTSASSGTAFSCIIFINPGAPLRPQQGTGSTVTIPQGIARAGEKLLFPFIVR
jgi:hypothetical protein